MSGTAKLPFEWIHVTIFLGDSRINDLGNVVSVLVCQAVVDIDVLGTVELLVMLLRLFH